MNDRRTEVISIRVEPELVEKIRRAATAERRPIANWARLVLIERLEELERQNG